MLILDDMGDRTGRGERWKRMWNKCRMSYWRKLMDSDSLSDCERLEGVVRDFADSLDPGMCLDMVTLIPTLGRSGSVSMKQEVYFGI